MKFEELAEIIHGKMLNEPSVSSLSNITADLTEVRQGSLFIAAQTKDAKEAIALGAYGVLFEDGDLRIIDNEVAWIEVECLDEALMRLIRYQLLLQEINVIYLEEIEFAIAKEICMDKRIIFLQGGYMDFLKAIQNPEIKFVALHNQALLNLSLDYLQAITPHHLPFKLIAYTLFNSKIYFNAMRYEIPLASIFLNQLASVLTLFQEAEILFDLSRFESISYFKPNFIGSQGTLCKFGQSGRVAIAEEKLEDFGHYVGYVTLNAKWAQTLLFVPNKYISLFAEIAPTQGYETTEILLEKIKNEQYNFALILGVNDTFLLTHLQETKTQASLFE